MASMYISGVLNSMVNVFQTENEPNPTFSSVEVGFIVFWELLIGDNGFFYMRLVLLKAIIRISDMLNHLGEVSGSGHVWNPTFSSVEDVIWVVWGLQRTDQQYNMQSTVLTMFVYNLE